MKTSEQRFPVRTSGKKQRTTRTPARVLAREAVEAMLEKKGHDLMVMDMRKVSGVADYFVVCTGDSELQIKAIADAVQEKIETGHRERPWHVEGYEHRQWVLLDYVDVVVHIFNGEKRIYYALERLWGDAPIEHVADDAASAEEVKMLAPEQKTQ